METKQIKIEVPNGYEIDKEKSTFENIILKPIENKLPLSVDEIPKGTYFNQYNSKLNAFRDLLLLRDAWNGDWRADWKKHQQMYDEGKPFKAFYGKIALKKEFQSETVISDCV